MSQSSLNDSQFFQLCELCDALLLDADATQTTVAVPWLHVIRAHPMFLSSYENLWEPRKTPYFLRRRLRNFASRSRSLLLAMRPSQQSWYPSKELPANADVLIVSHLLNSGFAGKDEDFYFADFANKLTCVGLNVVIALIDYTGDDLAKLSTQWSGALVPRVILARTLPFSSEQKLHKAAQIESKRLRAKASRMRNSSMRTVALRAADEAQGGACLHALRLGEQIRQLVLRLQPHSLITTYEGHSWERIAYAGGRIARPDIHCIGYQHAGLLPKQHAALRPLATAFNPDTILAAGIAGRDAMCRNLALTDTKIDCIGSNRSLSNISSSNPISERDACLVVPEGHPRECALLFDFSLACASHLPQQQFIWRLHPNMRLERLVKEYPHFAALPPNISLSSMPLTADIARSRWVLYRGSTTVIQAAIGGAFPVYLHKEGEIPIDPLYELEGLREVCTCEDEFIRLTSQTPFTKHAMLIEQIQEACRRMFVPLDSERLESIIRAGKKAIQEKDLG